MPTTQAIGNSGRVFTTSNPSPWTTTIAIDSDKHAAKTYSINFPDVDVRCGRVSDYIGNLPPSDLILGGPPCQPFSNAGDNEGEFDDRDGMPDYIAAVGHVKPRMFLMENVRGLTSKKHIGYFGRILAALEEAGYVVEWRVQDAVSFGVPQFRERIWIWGIRRDLYVDGIRHCFPKPTHVWPPPDLRQGSMFGGELLPGVTVGQALGISGNSRAARIEGASGYSGQRIISDCEPSPAVTGEGTNPEFIRVMGGGRNHPDKNPDGTWRRDERDITNEPSTTIASSGFALSGGVIPRVHYDHGIAELGEPCPTIKAGGNIDASGKQGGGCPPAILDRPSPTLIGGSAKSHTNGLSVVNDKKWRSDFGLLRCDVVDRPSDVITNGGTDTGGAEGLLQIDTKQPRTCRTIGNPSPTMGIDSRHHLKSDGRLVRRLTPDECMRLQSAPDSFVWPEGMPKTAKYRVAGNGWASKHAAEFARALNLADPESDTVIDLFCGGGLGACGWHQMYWELEAKC